MLSISSDWLLSPEPPQPQSYGLDTDQWLSGPNLSASLIEQPLFGANESASSEVQPLFPLDSDDHMDLSPFEQFYTSDSMDLSTGLSGPDAFEPSLFSPLSSPYVGPMPVAPMAFNPPPPTYQPPADDSTPFGPSVSMPMPILPPTVPAIPRMSLPLVSGETVLPIAQHNLTRGRDQLSPPAAFSLPNSDYGLRSSNVQDDAQSHIPPFTEGQSRTVEQTCRDVADYLAATRNSGASASAPNSPRQLAVPQLAPFANNVLAVLESLTVPKSN